MIRQRLCRALDLERRAYPANASPPGARWETGSLASLISFANCSCPPRGTWLGRKVTQSPTQGSRAGECRFADTRCHAVAVELECIDVHGTHRTMLVRRPGLGVPRPMFSEL